MRDETAEWITQAEYDIDTAWKRWEIIGDALAELMEPIEVLAFSPEEFEKKKEKQASFLQYIIKQPETIDVVF